MGLRPDEFGIILPSPVILRGVFGTTDDEKRILDSEGIDVPIDVLVKLENGTFAYKDRRVILYIRDVHQYGQTQREPRYHLADCRTLQDMRSNNRMGRYVISTRTDGIFFINIIDGSRRQELQKNLKVCQNCLDFLSFDKFDISGWPQIKRAIFVRDFRPDRFFKQYPHSPLEVFPHSDDFGAPLNDYTVDFPKISLALKSNCGWKCNFCNINLSDFGLRKFLHVHHKDGNRWNNSDNNLEVLCIKCHAMQPRHDHMKNLNHYKDFLQRGVAQ